MFINETDQAYSCLWTKIKHTPAYEPKSSILMLINQNRAYPMHIKKQAYSCFWNKIKHTSCLWNKIKHISCLWTRIKYTHAYEKNQAHSFLWNKIKHNSSLWNILMQIQQNQAQLMPMSQNWHLYATSMTLSYILEDKKFKWYLRNYEISRKCSIQKLIFAITRHHCDHCSS